LKSVKDKNQDLFFTTFRTSGQTTQNQYCPDKIRTVGNSGTKCVICAKNLQLGIAKIKNVKIKLPMWRYWCLHKMDWELCVICGGGGDLKCELPTEWAGNFLDSGKDQCRSLWTSRVKTLHESQSQLA
jgi:hypothetical protein